MELDGVVLGGGQEDVAVGVLEGEVGTGGEGVGGLRESEGSLGG